MKRLFFAIIFVLTSIVNFAQTKLPVSFIDFQAWAKEIKITGYKLFGCEQDGADYTAMLGGGPEKFFQIRLMNISQFSEYKMVSKDAAIYNFNGYKAVSYTFANNTVLTIELPQAQAAITFAMGGKIAKSNMEELASKSNLLNLKASKLGANTPGVKWPDFIPSDMRLNSVESVKQLGSDGTYKDVIEVKATMGQQLIESIQSILKKYGGNLNPLNTEKLDFICSEAENIDQLKSDFKNGQLVSFIYYIK
jgi:hypothetical protein